MNGYPQVRRPEKYGWEPRRLLSQLVDIYLNLDSPQFHAALAADEVNYHYHIKLSEGSLVV